MLTSIMYRSLFFLAIAAIGFGCKSNSVAPTVEQPVVRTPGEFGYNLNGVSYDRKDYHVDHVNCFASVLISDGTMGPAGGKVLKIVSLVLLGTGSTRRTQYVQLYIPFINTLPASYPVLYSGAPSGAYGSVDISDSEYYSETPMNGLATVTITKFDTVANIVSGTFNFDAVLSRVNSKGNYDPSQIIHVTSAYFNEIPIDVGSFGQGVISAMIDGDAFSTASGSPAANISAYNNAGQLAIQMSGWDGGSNTTKLLSFGIFTSKLGDYILSASNPIVVTLLIPKGSSYLQIGSSAGATGKFTLTKFDSVNNRLSATFDFSGLDTVTGKTIHVANGVINNVRWVVP